MSILSKILERTREELRHQKVRRPIAELKHRASDVPRARSFRAGLEPGFKIIGELKRRSPTMGDMGRETFSPALKAYNESTVVGAISVLTNKPFFGGSLSRLWRVRENTKKPVLRKDFIIDEYQV